MRAVNLLPAPRVEQRQDDGQRRGRTTKAVAIAAGLLLVFVTAALGFAFVHERSAVNDRQSTLSGLQAKVAQTHAAAASSAAAAAATQAQITAITSAASGRIAWDALLNQLSRVMPSGSSLVSLQANDGNSTSSAPSTSSSSTPSTSTTTSSAPASSLGSSTSGSASAPTSFVVSGYAASQATVAQVLDRLALIPALSDVSLQSTSDVAAANTSAAPNTNAVPANVVQFTIGANLRSAGGTPQ